MVLACMCLSMSACVPSVRGDRVQEPYYTFTNAPSEERIKIALVDVDVPEWVPQTLGEGEVSVAETLRAAVVEAFDGTDYQVVDETSRGIDVAFGPVLKPIILKSHSYVAILGKPYNFDTDNTVEAYGAPPISWSVVSAPPGFQLDPATGALSWIPQAPGETAITLEASNAEGVERYNFTVQVVEKEQEIVLRTPNSPSIGSDVPFVATFPQGARVDAPLLLAAHVVGWGESDEPYANNTRRRATLDVVYSMWTRAGELVETRRVVVSTARGDFKPDAPKFVPEWYSLSSDWNGDQDFRPKGASADNLVVKSAFEQSAHGFAIAYVQHDVGISVELKKTPELEPGLELAKQEKWQEAYESFASATEANTSLWQGYYNMAVMRMVQGDSREAVALLNKTLEIENTLLIRTLRDSYQRSVDRMKSFDLAAPAPAVEAQVPPEEEGDAEGVEGESLEGEEAP